MRYGYCRCSTNETKQDITRQIKELKEKNIKQENIYIEYESGSKIDRKELNKLLNIIDSNDTIVATEVSRITRSTRQLLEIIQLAEEKGIRLELGSLILDCSDKGKTDITTKAMLQMMGVFSELERNMISERVKSGMENARSKGKEIGRPKTTIADIPNKVKNTYKLYKNEQINKSEFARICEISRTTLYKYIGILEGEEG